VRSCRLLGGSGGAAGDVGEGGHAQAHCVAEAGDEAVDLGELVVRCGKADLQSLGLAGPALAVGLGDAGEQVVADVLKPAPLGGVDPQERAPDTAVLVKAGSAVCPAAVAERELAPFEVAEELVPFGLGGSTVFLAGAQLAAAGDERPVAVDGFLGIDR